MANRGSASRPAKPVTIYRRGKPVGNQPGPSSSSSASGSDQEEEEQEQVHHQPKPSSSTFPIINIETTSFDQKQNQSPETDSSEEESDDLSTKSKSKGTTKGGELTTKPVKTQPGSSSSDDDSSGSGSSSSGDEESDESEKLVPIYKPVFITKRNRETIPSQQTETEADLEAKRLEEEERRKKASQKLVEETLIREIAEKEVDQVFPDVDDTDGLDPEAEFEAWKLRELKRLRRDREALIQRAKEKEEIEARRMMPESERLKEDLEFAEKTRKAKPKGKQVFLQKFHHKGAFYTDSDIHKKHDFTAPTEGTFTKMELLPAVMQVRDFGKMSRTKWTHLVKEDTTSFDAGWSKKNPGRADKTQDGCFGCGERGHLKRDCPKNQGQTPGQGSNRVALGDRAKSNDDRHKKRRGSEDESREKEYPSKRRDGERERSGGGGRRSDDRDRRHYSPPRRDEERDRSKDDNRRLHDRERRDYSPKRPGRDGDRRDYSPKRSGRERDRRDYSPKQPGRERDRRDYSPKRAGRERDRREASPKQSERDRDRSRDGKRAGRR
ncbi:uncharacterized protein PGTG_16909 [Puccinia graminis f. sp. tritici CRL 75-36-700-3]|uniref:CCHC-type domain-containing protein n=1 Tax=Puccinia graminis f. sp. tritici (strain CRL 75-36-700-3 / race SCCL) TaxID=418459 RepID=E3L3N9_PUCGT|nr:uncharacterized protein PGTG_16909 [Puccinia graminis f. sp. tritici CRL 75-36-700-3]EFP91164.1 hypothetical protein PGTG_16909 [Puccinia graminis f. sp. tritici CRL 75-36-700-3]